MDTEDTSFSEDDDEDPGRSATGRPEPDDAPSTPPPKTDTTRRDIIVSIGAVAFTFTVVGAFGGNPGAQVTQAAPRPVEPGCWFFDEATCPGPDGDCDAGTTVESDRDESCGSGDGETDECCQLVSGSNSSSASMDTDENCSTNNDPDNSCGDCNDDHDTDENCGNALSGGGTDKDELCGHQHYTPFGGTEDAACSSTTTDEGCGSHEATYAGSWTDVDQHCTGTNADANCMSSAPDELCNSGGGSYTTSPDEGCSSSDVDEACGAGNSVNGDASYDQDQSCSSSQADESCGAGGVPIIGGGDTDEHA